MSEWPAAGECHGELPAVNAAGEPMDEQMRSASGVHLPHAPLPQPMFSEAAARQFGSSGPCVMLATPHRPPMARAPQLTAMGTAQGRCGVDAASSSTILAWPPCGLNGPPPGEWPFAAAAMACPQSSFPASAPDSGVMAAPPFWASGRFQFPGAPPPSPFCNISSPSNWSDDDDVEDDEEYDGDLLLDISSEEDEDDEDLQAAFLLIMLARRRQIDACLAASYYWRRYVATRRTRWGGSVPGRRVVHHDNAEGEASLMRDSDSFTSPDSFIRDLRQTFVPQDQAISSFMQQMQIFKQQEMQENSEARMTLLEGRRRMIHAKLEEVEIRKQEREAARKAEEERNRAYEKAIMDADLSAMNPIKRKWYESEQLRIVKARGADGDI